MYQEIMKKTSAAKQAPGLHTSPHKIKAPNKHPGHSKPEITTVGNVGKNPVHENQNVTKSKDATHSLNMMKQDISKNKPRPFEHKSTPSLKPFNEPKNHSSLKVCDNYSKSKSAMDSSSLNLSIQKVADNHSKLKNPIESSLNIKSGISPLVYYGKNSSENSKTSSNRQGKLSTLESKVTPLSLIVSQRNCVLQKRRKERQSFEDMLQEVEDSRTQEIIKKKEKRSAKSNGEKRKSNTESTSISPEKTPPPKLLTCKTLDIEEKPLLKPLPNKFGKSHGVSNDQAVLKSDTRKSDALPERLVGNTSGTRAVYKSDSRKMDVVTEPIVESTSNLVVEAKSYKNATRSVTSDLVESSKQIVETTKLGSDLISPDNGSSRLCNSPLNVSERKKPSKQTLRTQVIDHQRLFHYCLRKSYRLKHTNWSFNSDIEMTILQRKYQSLQIMFPKSLRIRLKRCSLNSLNRSENEKQTNKKADICSEVLPSDARTPESVKNNEQLIADSLVDPRVISLSKTLQSHKNGKVGLQKTFKSHDPLIKGKVLEKPTKPILYKKPDWSTIKEKLKAVSIKKAKAMNERNNAEKNRNKLFVQNENNFLKKPSYHSINLTNSTNSIPKLNDIKCVTDPFSFREHSDEACANYSPELADKTEDINIAMETDGVVKSFSSSSGINTFGGTENEIVDDKELENSYHYNEKRDNIFDKVATKISGNKNVCDDLGESFDVIPDLYAEREDTDINEDMSCDIPPPILEKVIDSPVDIVKKAVNKPSEMNTDTDDGLLDSDNDSADVHSDVSNDTADKLLDNVADESPSDIDYEKPHNNDMNSSDAGKDIEGCSTTGPMANEKKSDHKNHCSVSENHEEDLERTNDKADGLDLKIETICSISEFHVDNTSNENDCIDESVGFERVEIGGVDEIIPYDSVQSEIENKTIATDCIEYSNELNDGTEDKVESLVDNRGESGECAEVKDGISEQNYVDDSISHDGNDDIDDYDDDKVDHSNCDPDVNKTGKSGTMEQYNRNSNYKTEKPEMSLVEMCLNNIDELIVVKSSVNVGKGMMKDVMKGISKSKNESLNVSEVKVDVDDDIGDIGDINDGYDNNVGSDDSENDDDCDNDNNENDDLNTAVFKSNGNNNHDEDDDNEDNSKDIVDGRSENGNVENYGNDDNGDENDLSDGIDDDDDGDDDDTQTIKAIDSDEDDDDEDNTSIDHEVDSPRNINDDNDDSCSLPDIETTTVQFPAPERHLSGFSEVQSNNGLMSMDNSTNEGLDAEMNKDGMTKCKLAATTVPKSRTRNGKSGRKDSGKTESGNDRLVYEFPNHNWFLNKYSQSKSSDCLQKKLKTVSPQQKGDLSSESFRALNTKKVDPMKSSLDSRLADCLKGFKSDKSNLETFTESKCEINKKSSNKHFNTLNKVAQSKIKPMNNINQEKTLVCAIKTPQTTIKQEVVSKSLYLCENEKSFNVQSCEFNDDNTKMNLCIKDPNYENEVKTKMAESLNDNNANSACIDELKERTTLANEDTGHDVCVDTASNNHSGIENIENERTDNEAGTNDKSLEMETDIHNENESLGIDDEIKTNDGNVLGENSDYVEKTSECISGMELMVKDNNGVDNDNDDESNVNDDNHLSLDDKRNDNDNAGLINDDNNDGGGNGNNNDNDDNVNGGGNGDDNDDNGEDSKLVIDELTDDPTTIESEKTHDGSESVVNEISEEINGNQNTLVTEPTSTAVESIPTVSKTPVNETKEVHEPSSQHKEINVSKPEATEVTFRPRTKPLVQLVHPQVHKPADSINEHPPLLPEVHRSSNTTVFSETEVSNTKLSHSTWTSPSSPISASRVSTCVPACSTISISSVCYQTLASAASIDSQESKCLTETNSMLTTTMSTYGSGLVLPVQPFLQNVNNEIEGDVTNVKETEVASCNNDTPSAIPGVMSASETKVGHATELSLNKNREKTVISQSGSLPAQKCLNSRPPPLLAVPKTTVPPMQASKPSNIATMVPSNLSVYPVSVERTQIETSNLSNMTEKCSSVKSEENDAILSGDSFVEDDVDDEIKKQMEELDAEMKRKQREQEEIRQKKIMLLEKMKQSKSNNSTKHSEDINTSSNSSSVKEPVKTKVKSEVNVKSVEPESIKCQSDTNNDGNTYKLVSEPTPCTDIVLTALAKSGHNSASNLKSENHSIFNESHSVTVTDGVISITETSLHSGSSELLASDDSLLDLALSTNISVTDTDGSCRNENLLSEKDTNEIKVSSDAMKNESLHFIEDIRAVNPFTGKFDTLSEIEADNEIELDLSMPSKTIVNKTQVEKRSPVNSELKNDSVETSTSVSNEIVTNLKTFDSNEEHSKKLSDHNNIYSDIETSDKVLNLTKVSCKPADGSSCLTAKVDQEVKSCTSISTSLQLTVTSVSLPVPLLNLPVPSSMSTASNSSLSLVPSSMCPSSLSSTSFNDSVNLSSTVLNTPVSTEIENLSVKNKHFFENSQSNVTTNSSMDLTVPQCKDQNILEKSGSQNVKDIRSTDGPLNLTHVCNVTPGTSLTTANHTVSKSMDYTCATTVNNNLSCMSEKRTSLSNIPKDVHNTIDPSSSVMSLVNMASKRQSSDAMTLSTGGKRPNDLNIAQEHLSPSKVMYLQDKPVSVESVNGVLRLTSQGGVLPVSSGKRKRLRSQKLVEIRAAHSKSPPKKIKLTKPEPAHIQRTCSVEILRKLNKTVCQVPLTIRQSSPHFRRLEPIFLSPRECIKPFPKLCEKKQPRPAHSRRPFGIAGHLIVNALKKRRRGLSTSHVPPPKFYSLPSTPTTPPCTPPRTSSASAASDNILSNCVSQSDKQSESCVSTNLYLTSNVPSDDDFPIKAHCRPNSSVNKDKFYETSVLRPPSIFKQGGETHVDQNNVIDLTTDVIVVQDDEKKVTKKNTKEKEKVIQDELHYAMSRRPRTESVDHNNKDLASTSIVSVEKHTKTNPRVSEAEVIRKTFAMPPPPYTGRQRMPVLAQFPRKPPFDQPRIENNSQVHPQGYVRGNLPPAAPRMQFIPRGTDVPPMQRMQHIPRGVEGFGAPRMQYVPSGVENPVAPRMQFIPRETHVPSIQRMQHYPGGVEGIGVPRMQYVPSSVEIHGASRMQFPPSGNNPTISEAHTGQGIVHAQNPVWSKSPPCRSLNNDLHYGNKIDYGNKIVQDQGATYGSEQVVMTAHSKPAQGSLYPGKRVMSGQPVLHPVNSADLQPNSRFSQMEPTTSMAHGSDISKEYPGNYVHASQYPSNRHTAVVSQQHHSSIPVTNPQLHHGNAGYPNTSYKTQVHKLLQKPRYPHQGMVHGEDPNLQAYHPMHTNSRSPETGHGDAHNPQLHLSFGRQISPRQYNTQVLPSEHSQQGHLHSVTTSSSYPSTNRGNVLGMPSPGVPSPQAAERREFSPTAILPRQSPVLNDPQIGGQGRSHGIHAAAQPMQSSDVQSGQFLTDDQKFQSMQRIRANHIRNQQLHERTHVNNLQSSRFPSPAQQPTGAYNMANPAVPQTSNFKAQQLQSSVSPGHIPTSTKIQQIESPIHSNYNPALSNRSPVSPRSVHQASQAQQLISVQGHSTKGQGHQPGYTEVNQNMNLAQNRSQMVQNHQNFAPAQAGNRQSVQANNHPNSEVTRQYTDVKDNIVQSDVHSGHGRQQTRTMADPNHMLNVQGRQAIMIQQNFTNPNHLISHQHVHSSASSNSHNRPILPKPPNYGTNLVSSEMTVSKASSFNPLPAHHQDPESKYSPQPNVHYSQQGQNMSNQVRGHNVSGQGQVISDQAQNILNQGQGQNMQGQAQNRSTPVEIEVKDEDESENELPHLQQVHGECFMCGKYSLYLCSNCKLIWYCSPECQLTHWQTHAAECLGPSS